MRTSRPNWRSEHGPGNDAGFTLAEVIVSLTILTTVAIAASALVLNLLRTTRATQLRVSATNIAQQDLQKMRALNSPTDSSAIVSSTSDQTIDGIAYTIVRTVTLVPNATPCSVGGYRIVNTTVTPRNGRSVSLTTRIAC